MLHFKLELALNQELYQLSAPHRFARKPNEYDFGYLKMNSWLNEMCYYYEKKRKEHEQMSEEEFKELIDEQKEKIYKMKSSLYKKGLLKAINEV